MAILSTPLIKRIPQQGGLFYTFPSALEDLNLNVGEGASSKKFRFSKFALLHIPEHNEYGREKNTIKFKANPSGQDVFDLDDVSNPNQRFAESLQNYCLNLETSIQNSPGYDGSLFKTVSERVFFKWLKELSVIRFSTSRMSDGNIAQTFYQEEQDSQNYQRVVKYIGEISAVNSKELKNSNYTEVFVHVPTTHGSTPNVLFSSHEDENYSPGLQFKRTDNPINEGIIWGKTISDNQHPDLLKVAALHDKVVTTSGNISSLNEISLFKKITNGPFTNENIVTGDGSTTTADYSNSIENRWWYNESSVLNNSYVLEPSTFLNVENDRLAIFKRISSGSGTDVNDPSSGAIRFVRSKADGICINWDLSAYQRLYPGVRSFSEISSLPDSESFEFNAIAIYYDITGPDENGEEHTETNLYGVLFLDQLKSSQSLSENWKIPTTKKIKPNRIAGFNGNAVSFKLNIKLHDSQNLVAYDDSSTFTFDMFSDAISELRNLVDVLISQRRDFTFDRDRLTSLEQNISLLGKPLDLLENRINALETIIASNSYVAQAANSSAFSEIVFSLKRDLSSLLNSRTNRSIEFNFDNLLPGEGISIDKNATNKSIFIKNIIQNYNLSDEVEIKFPYDFSSNQSLYSKTIALQNHSNYLRIFSIPISEYTTNITLKNKYPKKDVYFYIDDSIQQWERGQTYTFYFKNELTFIDPTKFQDTEIQTGSTVFFYTDARNSLQLSRPFSKKIGQINFNDFKLTDDLYIFNKRYCVITCIDPARLEFIIDVPN